MKTTTNNTTNTEHKIIGLRKIAGESKTLQGFYSPSYLQVFYSPSEGRAWSVYHCSIGHNAWTVYHDPAIVSCGNICRPCTMREVREQIERTLYERCI